MLERFFSELDQPTPAPEAGHDASTPTFLLIEPSRINVVLHCHNVHGVLLEDSTHPTINAAKAHAEAHFGGKLKGWTPIPPGYTSMQTILAERRRQRLASGDAGLDLMLAYYRPRPLYRDRDHWWQGVWRYALLNGSLLIAFYIVVIGHHPLGYYLFNASWGQGNLLIAFHEVVLLSLMLGSLLWHLPRVQGILCGMAVFLMGMVLTFATTFGSRGSTASEIVIAIFSATPFILLSLWRSMQIAHRWVED